MTFVWATGTHVGRVRDHNEDSVYPENGGRSDGPVLIAVADGMGGHAGGEVASRIAIEVATSTDAPPAERVSSANSAVLAHAGEEPGLRGMGTTLTLAILDGDAAEIAHVGDSRCYLLRDEELTRVTDDHSYVEWLQREGRITAEDAAGHPMRHVVMRALGLEEEVEIDSLRQDLRHGDRLLLCSDGLTTMVSDDRIREVLLAESAPEAAVWTLIEEANSAGGMDNTTVAVVDVEQ